MVVLQVVGPPSGDELVEDLHGSLRWRQRVVGGDEVNTASPDDTVDGHVLRGLLGAEVARWATRAWERNCKSPDAIFLLVAAGVRIHKHRVRQIGGRAFAIE